MSGGSYQAGVRRTRFIANVTKERTKMSTEMSLCLLKAYARNAAKTRKLLNTRYILSSEVLTCPRDVLQQGERKSDLHHATTPKLTVRTNLRT